MHTQIVQDFRFERERFSVNVLFQLIFCASCVADLTRSVFVFVASGNVMSILVDVWRVISMFSFSFACARFLT